MNGDGHNDVGVGQQLRVLRAERRERRDHDDARHARVARERGRGRQLRSGRRLAPDRRRVQHAEPHEPLAGVLDADAAARRRRGRCSAATPLHHAGPVALHLLPAGSVPRRVRTRARIRSPSSSQGYWVVGRRRRGLRAQGRALPRQRGRPDPRRRRSRWRRRTPATATTCSTTAAASSRSATRARSVRWPGVHLNAPIIALAPTPSGRGYWLLASRRRRVQLRRRALLRFDGRQAPEQADHLDGGDAHRPRLLAAGVGRRRVQLRRRALPRFDRQHPPELAGHLDGDRAVGPGLLAGRAATAASSASACRSTAAFPGIGLCQSAPGVQIRPTLTGHGYFVLALERPGLRRSVTPWPARRRRPSAASASRPTSPSGPTAVPTASVRRAASSYIRRRGRRAADVLARPEPARSRTAARDAARAGRAAPRSTASTRPVSKPTSTGTSSA